MSYTLSPLGISIVTRSRGLRPRSARPSDDDFEIVCAAGSPVPWVIVKIRIVAAFRTTTFDPTLTRCGFGIPAPKDTLATFGKIVKLSRKTKKWLN